MKPRASRCTKEVFGALEGYFPLTPFEEVTLRKIRGPAQHQFGLGLRTWSITSTSTWPLTACSLSPSCSCKAANIVGACMFVPRIGLSGPAAPVGAGLGIEAASSGE